MTNFIASWAEIQAGNVFHIEGAHQMWLNKSINVNGETAAAVAVMSSLPFYVHLNPNRSVVVVK